MQRDWNKEFSSDIEDQNIAAYHKGFAFLLILMD